MEGGPGSRKKEKKLVRFLKCSFTSYYVNIDGHSISMQDCHISEPKQFELNEAVLARQHKSYFGIV